MGAQSEVPENALASIRRLELFKGLGDDVLKRLAATMIEIRLAKGETLIEQGDVGDAIYVVTHGGFRAEIHNPDGTTIVVGQLKPGQPIGEIQLVVGGTRLASVIAEEPSKVLKLERKTLDDLVSDFPVVLEQLTSAVTYRLRLAQLNAILPTLFGPVKEELLQDLYKRLEWISLKRGEVLFRQGDVGDAWYVVMHGRLQALICDDDEGERVAGEIGRGESVGEIAILTNRPRTATVIALRDCQVVRFSRAMFQDLLPKWPHVLMSIAETLIDRLLQSRGGRAKRRADAHIAVVATGPGAPLREFAAQFTEALSAVGQTLHLDSKKLSALRVVDHAPEALDDEPQWLRFSAWFEEQCSRHHYIVLEADRSFTGWTVRSVRECDWVLLLVDATAGPALSELEENLARLLDGLRGVKTALVLVHPGDTTLPSGTERFLASRSVDAHYHVRRGRKDDVARIARLLTGRAIGVALGGGGARGAAHYGVVRALREARIPIDMVGGTSAGAIAAGAVAMELGYDEMIERSARSMSIRPFAEYTLPLMSVVRSDKIGESARIMFGDNQIEDLWIGYFAISSDLTAAEMVIHDRGPLWLATRASGSLPGIALPVVHGNDLLVDGGIINNLPADVMAQRCGGPVIAVNVSPKEDLRSPAGGEFPSPWKLLSSKLVPGRAPIETPNILSILMRTTLLASASRDALVRRDADLFLDPPTDGWGMLEFDASREIAEAGYAYAIDALEKADLSVLGL